MSASSKFSKRIRHSGRFSFVFSCDAARGLGGMKKKERENNQKEKDNGAPNPPFSIITESVRVFTPLAPSPAPLFFRRHPMYHSFAKFFRSLIRGSCAIRDNGALARIVERNRGPSIRFEIRGERTMCDSFPMLRRFFKGKQLLPDER